VPDKEDLRIIKCICEFDESHWQMVSCAGCTTWQHIGCYYSDEPLPDVHNCLDCDPLTLDMGRSDDLLPLTKKARYDNVNEVNHQLSESKAPSIHSQPGMNSTDSTDSTSMIPYNVIADRLQAANQGHLSIQSTTPPAIPVNNEGYLFSLPNTSFIDEGNEVAKNSLPLSQTSGPGCLASRSAISSLHPAATLEPPRSSTSLNNVPPPTQILNPQEATPVDRELALSNVDLPEISVPSAVLQEVRKQGPFSTWQADYLGVSRSFNICTV
jgi:hypothetical protein